MSMLLGRLETMTEPLTGPAAPFPERPPAAPPTKTPGWLIALVAAFGGLVIGGLGGAAVGALIVRQVQVERDFETIVFVEQTATEEQRAAVRAAVDRAAPGEVETRSAQDNFELFKKDNADNPELIAQLRPESFGESLLYRTHGVNADCRPVRTLRKVDGVRDVIVHMPADGDRLEGNLICPKSG
jgi:hypothetical protein